MRNAKQYLLITSVILGSFLVAGVAYADTYTLQPGPEGTDTYYGTSYGTGGNPNAPDLSIGGWGDWYYDFFNFDISNAPGAASTSQAQLYVYGAAPNNPAINIYRITASWTEAGVTSASNPANTLWGAAAAVPTTANWITTDITTLYTGWKNGTWPNYGLKFTPTSNANTNGSIASSDNTTVTNRPRLVITTTTGTAVRVDAISPATAANTGAVSLTSITGANFASGATVKLTNGAQILVVGGGGGGGGASGSSARGGGGGAGGYRTGMIIPSVASYAITVGAGGAGGPSTGTSPGSTGGVSSFAAAIVSDGGGGGGTAVAGVSNTQATNGGSGGGAGAGNCHSSMPGGTGNTGGYSPSEGNGGGYGNGNCSQGNGGGGGGSSGAGHNDNGAPSPSDSLGGAGTANSISGASVTYAAGGNAGGAVNPGVAGAANTGNGGNGNIGTSVGGAGGSGVVIISYPTGTISATGGTITTSGGNTIHTFTSSGTFNVSSVQPVITYITCTGVTFVSATSLTGGSCPITGATPGLWNLEVTNTDGSKGTLSPGFEIFTPGVPTVTTPTVTSVTSTTATLGANLTAVGGSAIIARGTCWATTASPTANCVAEGGTATGAFTHARTGITSGTTIYYRGYATNSIGTGYSADGIFTTMPPTVTTPTVTSVTSTTATLGANVTSSGGTAITARGTCWATTASPTANCVAEGGTATGAFTHARTGITSGTTIYYRGYATNSIGTGYSADGIFTTMPPAVVTSAATLVTPTTATLNGTGNPNRVTATGWFRYSTTNPGTCDDVFGTRVPVSGGSALGAGSAAVAFSQGITSLIQNTTYYYCAIASNSVGTGFGAMTSFATTAVVVPTITTPTAAATDVTVRLEANVTSDGGAGVLIARGTCWGTTITPTTNCLDEGGTTAGIFAQGRTGLPSNTLIYFRGYATNSVGTAYSADGSFTTGTNPGVTATGGTITTFGGRNIHTFTTSGTFTVTGATGSGNVEVLVVGGSGGGGGAMGGGGGAGGLIYNSSFNVTAQAYTVTVGAGGAGGSGTTSNATNGTNSIFSTLTAIGGGAGGRYSAIAGFAGGSGGGGGAYTRPGGAGTAGQGNAGGPSGTSIWKSGGGGGAGAVGATGGSGAGNGGPGGNGLNYFFSGSSVYYAGGGGGGGYSGSCSGTAAGGLGGGGTGTCVSNGAGIAGTPYTGGGGGGGGYSTGIGGTGGSGVVIISYTTSAPPTVTSPTATAITSSSATLGANVTSDGGATLTARGTCWGTTATPVTNCNPEGSTVTGVFTMSATGLPSATLIYYRGYATNSASTTYSPDGTFTTLAVVPTLTLPTATSITTTGATLGATITSDGGATITARGTCWATSANPLTNCLAEGGTAVSAFTHARTGMSSGTLIFYRGYATNSIGTSYSPDGNFTTLTIPTVTAINPTSGVNNASKAITTVGGTNFVSGATVSLTKSGQTTISCTGFTFTNSTTLSTGSCPITGAATGTWNVVVTNPDAQIGTLTNGFTVILPAPTVTSINPTTGTNNASASITSVGGTNFVSGATVSLTKSGQTTISCTSFTFSSSVSLTAGTCPITGAAGGAWNVVVTNPDAQVGTLTNGFTVTAPAPTVSVINPISGFNTGSVAIAFVTGTNFVSGATVSLLKTGQTTISCTGFTFTNSTTLSTGGCPITGAALGAWDVRVTNPDAQFGTFSGAFTISTLITGSLISSTFNTGVAKGVNYNSIMWKGVLGTGGVNYVTFQFAASNCPNGQTNAPTCNTGTWAYLGPGGSTSTYYTTSGPNSPVPLNGSYSKGMRYYRYKIVLQRSDIATSPRIDDVIVNWSP